MDKCLKCPDNSVADVNKTGCRCHASYYMVNSSGVNSSSIACESCPSGADCADEGLLIQTVLPEKGYFKGRDNSGKYFYPCLNEDVCLENDNCQNGYTGVGCTVCDDVDLVLISGTFECKRCGPKGAVALIVLWALLMSVMGYTFYLRGSRKTKRDRGEFWIWAKIFVTSWYVMSSSFAFAFNFNDWLFALMGLQRNLQTLGTTYMEIQCVWRDMSLIGAFYLENVFYEFAPLVVIGSIFLASWLRQARQKVDATEESSDNIRKYAWFHTAFSVSTVFMFLVHPSIAERVWILFSCVEMGNEEGSPMMYMLEEPSIECWEATHMSILTVFAVPMLVVYVLGVPIIGVYTIVMHKAELQFLATHINEQTGHTHISAIISIQQQEAFENFAEQHLDTVEKQEEFEEDARQFHLDFAFLFQGFKMDVCWWEGIMTLRKVLLGFISVYHGDRFLQSNLAVVLLFVSTVLHLMYEPFNTALLDMYETCCLFISTMLFMVGQISTGPGYESYKNIAQLLGMILYVTWVTISIFVNLRIQSRIKATEEDDEEEPDPQIFLELRGFEELKHVDRDLKQKQLLLEKHIESTDVGQGSTLVIDQLKDTVRSLKQLKRQYAGYQKVSAKSLYNHLTFIELSWTSIFGLDRLYCLLMFSLNFSLFSMSARLFAVCTSAEFLNECLRNIPYISYIPIRDLFVNFLDLHSIIIYNNTYSKTITCECV